MHNTEKTSLLEQQIEINDDAQKEYYVVSEYEEIGFASSQHRTYLFSTEAKAKDFIWERLKQTSKEAQALGANKKEMTCRYNYLGHSSLEAPYWDSDGYKLFVRRNYLLECKQMDFTSNGTEDLPF